MSRRSPAGPPAPAAARPEADGSPLRPPLRLRFGVGLLVGGLCAGCLAGPAAPPRRAAGDGRVTSGARPAAVGDVGGAAGTGAAAAGVVQARALQGLVALPRRLAERAVVVANNGGSVLSNNGGNLISDNGGGLVGKVRWTLLQAATGQNAPVPLAGTEVHLVDAAGQPVRDAAGRPLVAVTDAAGRYAFADAMPARNLIVEVRLAAGWGVARALAPRDVGARSVDVDLASSLATGYVLAKYVRTQADPLATLERLPADVEAETRTRTASALARAGGAIEALTDERVVAAVEGLRGRDAALNAQMEVVRELLILAGVSDLGTGRPATAVRLALGGFAVAPDGTRYLLAGRRVWRIGSDGRLVVHAGNGAVGEIGVDNPEAVTDGEVATAIPLYLPGSLVVDAQGRAVFEDGGRLLRVERDGRIRVLALDLVDLLGGGMTSVGRIVLLPGPGDEVWAYGKYTSGAPTWWALAPGQAPRRVLAIRWTRPVRNGSEDVAEDRDPGTPEPGEEDESRDDPGPVDEDEDLDSPERPGASEDDGLLADLGEGFHGLVSHDWARTPEGKLRFIAADEAGRAVFEVDPGAPVPRRLMPAREADRLTPDGRIVRAGPEIVEVRLDGSTSPLGRPVSPGFAPVDAVAGADGTMYVYDAAYVLALGRGEPRVVAGMPPIAGGAVTAGQDYAFQQLGHLAPAPGGGIFAADTGRERVVHLDRDRRVTSRAGGGTASGWQRVRAQDVRLHQLGKIAADAAGRLYVAYAAVDKVTSSVIGRVDADGQLAVIFPAAPPEDESGGTKPSQSVTGPAIESFCVAPDGDVYVLTDAYATTRVRTLWRVPANGVPERLADLSEQFRTLRDALVPRDFEQSYWSIGDMALDPKGVLHLCTRLSLLSWRPDAGLQVVVADIRALGGQTDGEVWASPFTNGTIAFDAKGRCYRSTYESLVRLDPAAGTLEVIAGRDGIAFSGSGVDDGVHEPGSPHLDAAGNLVFADAGHQQIKRIDAGKL